MSYFHYYFNTIVTALVCYLYDEFLEKDSLTDKFPSLSFVRDFPRLQRKILRTTKIALVSCSCRNKHNESETGCRLRELNLNGFMPVGKKPVKNHEWRRVHEDFLRLLKGIQQLMRWI